MINRLEQILFSLMRLSWFLRSRFALIHWQQNNFILVVVRLFVGALERESLCFIELRSRRSYNWHEFWRGSDMWLALMLWLLVHWRYSDHVTEICGSHFFFRHLVRVIIRLDYSRWRVLWLQTNFMNMLWKTCIIYYGHLRRRNKSYLLLNSFYLRLYWDNILIIRKYRSNIWIRFLTVNHSPFLSLVLLPASWFSQRCSVLF